MSQDVSYIIIACYPDKGMKSCGSKSLIDFNKKRLLQYQIDCISKSKHSNYEIIVITDFEIQKIQKTFNGIQIASLENRNPIYLGCQLAKYSQVVFIDYGCLFSKNLINELKKTSCVIYSKVSKNNNLNTGCLIRNSFLEHIFFDLTDNKFCNMFAFSKEDKHKTLEDASLDCFNLLSFEIINKLIEKGSAFDTKLAKQEDFIYFNHTRQKNAINRFIKKAYS